MTLRDFDERFGWAFRLGLFLVVVYAAFAFVKMAVDRLPVDVVDSTETPCR